jgi:hypothetical protein
VELFGWLFEKKGGNKMSDAFLKSNQQLDKAVQESESFESMRERMKTVMESQGVITRTREEGQYGAHLTGRHASLPVPAAAQAREDFKYSRVIYPHQNDRFEISGASEAELDAREAQIRAMFV